MAYELNEQAAAARRIADTELEETETWRPIIGTCAVLGIRQLWDKRLENAWTDSPRIGKYGHYRRVLKGLFEEIGELDDPVFAAILVTAHLPAGRGA